MNGNDGEIFINAIRSLVRDERIALKKHCFLRMRQRTISLDEFKEAMSCAALVEYYKDDHPLPSALILGFTNSGRPLHAVAALDSEEEVLWIITLYEPDTELWNERFNKRRI